MRMNKHFFLMAGLGLGLAVSALGASVTNLHYLIVDRSGSIKDSNLTVPLMKAVKEHVNTLGEKDEVKIIFFDNTWFGERTWPQMDFDAKVEFGKHFEKLFKPDRGSTLLYDTAAKVLDDVLPIANRYDTIKLLILSDGDDSSNGVIKTWAPVVDRACKLMKANPNSLITFYTIGFNPSNKPSDCIQTTHVHSNAVVIPPDPPRADFEAAPREVLVGEEVTFFARRSLGKVDRLEWSFGDSKIEAGALETHEVVRHTYGNAGLKTIRLVASGIGGRDEKEKVGYVAVKERERPVARFSWNPEQPRVNESVAFINQSAGNPESYRWDFGALGSSTEASPRATMAQAGTYAVSLVASKGSVSHTAKASMVVLPLAPEAGFTIDPAGDVDVGQTLVFQAKATGAGLQHAWTINQSAGKPEARVEWTAGEPGTVEVVHEVKGPGGVATQREKVFVRAIAKPDADFVITPEPVELGAEVTVRASKDQEGWAHHWTIAGRTYDQTEVTLRPEQAGALPVAHEVVFKGQTSHLDKTVAVIEVARLAPAFTASPRKGKRPLSVQFKDKTEGVVTAYAWDFGDGGNSPDRSPSHTYEAAGTYSVKLSVENKFGHRTTSAELVVITVTNPLPGWVWPSVGGALLALAGLVAFIKTRPVPPGGTLQWDLPEGGRSKPVTVGGTKFDLGAVKAPGWKADGSYQIVVKGGKRVVLKDGDVLQELGRDKRFKAGGVQFRYMNQLLEE